MMNIWTTLAKNFALYIEMAMIVLAIAGIILFFAMRKKTDRSIKKFLFLLIFLTIDLIAFGAFTRLTDSGLGCPDWPGCYQTSNPFLAQHPILLAQHAAPGGPVSWSKAWIEMIHRYFAASLGFLLMVQLYGQYRRYQNAKKQAIWHQADAMAAYKKSYLYSWGLLILVMIQGAFGAWTVQFKLQPLVVSLHLLLALCLLVALIILAARECRLDNPHHFYASTSGRHVDQKNVVRARMQRYIRPMIFVLVLQIFLGAWTSTHYAVLGCYEFPTCIRGQWWPPADWAQALLPWRAVDAQGFLMGLPQSTLTAIHLLHRLGALAVVLLFVWMYGYFRYAFGRFGVRTGYARYLHYAGALLLLQVMTGVANVVLGYPLLAALLHTVGASLCLSCLTYTWYALKHES